jgi:type 1 glutamine amidotransferase
MDVYDMKITTRALVLSAVAAAWPVTDASFGAAVAAEALRDRPAATWARGVTGAPQAAGATGQTEPVRRRREITPEERAKIEAALPSRAPAVPQKPRRLLVFDLNVGYGGHASIPYANLAIRLMGERTGSFEATVSSDPAVLEAVSLRQFDAVFLNNTVGDIFATEEVRRAFAAFVAGGGGLAGNHGASVASTDWQEFGEILGGRGASHREPDETVVINVEDPTHPITRAFGAEPFEFTDEIYRLDAPYSRDMVRVLLSVDPIATNMMQGRCYGRCLRDDNDYPVAWIREHGKGRVFYTSIGHHPDAFWDPRVLHMFLAGVQYALGDLQADATPRPRDTSRFDDALAGLAGWDWGRDRAPVRRFEQEVALMAATAAGAAEAEEKMLKVLQGDAPLGAKDAICRQLAIFGSPRSEAVLNEMLRHEQTRGMAQYALNGLRSK